MLNSFFIPWLLTIPFSLIHAEGPPPPKGFFLNCGASEAIELYGLKYEPDSSFISTGNTTDAKSNSGQLEPILSKVRFFPDKSARKSCYLLPVTQGTKYLVRTTYYYGEFDGGKQPPVFDQIIDGTTWSVVNTTEDYAKGMASYYELVIAAQNRVLAICVARNRQTSGDSSPFISGLEVIALGDTLYKSVDFGKFMLSTVARNTFGWNANDSSEDGIISFPDDQFHRFWVPFEDTSPMVKCQANITPSDFWNMPPIKALKSGTTASRGKSIQIQWPKASLPGSNYHISLYFQDNRSPSPFSWRVFSISVNGQTFYTNVNVTTKGVNVYATQWPISAGQAQITLAPAEGAPVGPLINAAEMFQIVPLGGRTNARDVMAMEDMCKSFKNPPSDWTGDPCLPKENSWTGVSCSQTNDLAGVASVNLTGKGISGSLSPSIGNLSAIAHLWLGDNKLSGSLPDLSAMKTLETLHLENNQLEGSIPESLGNLPRIREIFLQNNKFSSDIPNSLKSRNGVNIRLKD